MYEIPGRNILLAALVAAACASLGACGTSPADFGITGPNPGMSLTPPAPTAAQAAAQANPDAAGVMPGARTGGDTYAPSILIGPPEAGSFYGSN